MAENDLKEPGITKTRDPRKVFLRTGNAKPHLHHSEGGTSCSESDFDVSSPSAQSVCSSTSYAGSARSPTVPSDLSLKSAKSPGSPFGGPLSFPGLDSINSPFSDFGPLSVSELLKSPSSSVAEFNEIDNIADCPLPKEVGLDSPAPDNSFNIDADDSSSLSTVPSTKSADHYSGVGYELTRISGKDQNHQQPVDQTPDSIKPSKVSFDIHQSFIHPGSGHLLDRLISPDRQKQLDLLYHQQTQPDRSGLDLFDTLCARSPRNDRYSPLSKTSESAVSKAHHQSVFRHESNDTLRSAFTDGKEVKHGHAQLTPGYRHATHAAAGYVSSSRDKTPVVGIMKDYDSASHAHHDKERAAVHRPGVASTASQGEHAGPGAPNVSSVQRSAAKNLRADVLTDHVALEMLRQEVFKRTSQSLDLPPDFPWYQRPNNEGSVNCSPENTPKRPNLGQPRQMVTDEQNIQYGGVSVGESRMPGARAGLATSSSGMCASNGGEGSESSRSGYESQISSVSSGAGQVFEDKASVAAESTSGDIDVHICQICGDVAAGFHCGAYVCEACKKFFVRCLKQEQGVKFVCPRNKTCNITKETRTQCQYCRYQKCLTIGMYRPGGANISSEICHIPCKVCGAPSSGYHFGAITCEGCKGFFRRTIKERDSMKYQCSRNGSCTITTATRNVCKYCRYRKCLDVGMKADGSRIGRQPNSVKHATMIQLKQIKTSKGLQTSDLPVRIDSVDALFKQEPQMDSGYGVSLPVSIQDSSSTSPIGMSGLHGHHSLSELDEDFQHTMPQMADRRPSDDVRCSADMMSLVRDRGFPISRSTLPSVQPEPRGLLPYPQGLSVPIRRDVPFDHLDIHVNDPSSLPSGLFSSSPTNTKPSMQSSPMNVCSHTENTTDRAVPMETDSSSSDHHISVSPPEVLNTTSGTRVHTIEKVHSKTEPATIESPGDSLPHEYTEQDSIIRTLEHASRYLDPIKRRSSGTQSIRDTMGQVEVWQAMMAQFGQSAHAVLKFAKKVPGFRKLPIQQQIATVQSCMYPVVLAVLSMFYKPATKEYNYFHMTPEEERIVLANFPSFLNIMPSFHSLGNSIQQISMDWTEISFLCALHLLEEGTGQDQEVQSLLVSALERYCKRVHGEGSNRHGLILLRLGDLVKANLCHQKAVMDILSQPDKYAGITIPELFHETFLNT